MYAITGYLIWDYPLIIVDYNLAFELKEWRKLFGIYRVIGVVERDMQITIATCSNHPPQIQSLRDTCVLANDSIGISVAASDPDHNLIEITSTGGPYNQVSPPNAQFFTNPSTPFSSDN